MDNEQHGTGLRFNLNRTQRMPALFFCIPIDAVRIDQATFVLEGQRSQLKGKFRRVFAGSADSSPRPIRNAWRIYVVYYRKAPPLLGSFCATPSATSAARRWWSARHTVRGHSRGRSKERRV